MQKLFRKSFKFFRNFEVDMECLHNYVCKIKNLLIDFCSDLNFVLFYFAGTHHRESSNKLMLVKKCVTKTVLYIARRL